MTRPASRAVKSIRPPRASERPASSPALVRGSGAGFHLTPSFLLQACWLTVAFLTPSLFNPASIRVFEPEKIAFIRSAAILTVALWGVQAALRTQDSALSTRSGNQSSVISPWRLELPIGALVACYVVSALLSDLPGVSFLGSYRRQFGAITYLSFAAIALVVSAQLRSSSQARRLLLAIALGAVVPSLYAVVQKLGLDPIPWTVDNSRRVVGTLGQPTYLGAYLAAVMPATLWLLARSRSMRWRTALTLLLALQLLALLFSQSRAAWAGAAAGLLVVAPFHDMGRLLGQRGRRIVLGSIGVVLVFLLAINLPGTPLNSFARSVPYLERLASVSDFESGSGKVRAVIWQALPALISERPVLGQGPDMMGYAFERHYPPELAYAENRTASADEAHNVLLQQLVNVGALGLLAFLWLLVGVLHQPSATSRQSSVISHESSAISYQLSVLSPGYAALAGIVAWLVEGMAGVPSASAYLLFWLYVGLVAAMARMSEANTSPAGDGDGAGREGTVRGKGTAISRRRPPGARVVRWGAVALVVAIAVVGTARLGVMPLAADVAAAQGEGLASQGRFAEALPAYQRAISLNPEAEYYLLLGQAATRAAETGPASRADGWLGQGEVALQRAEELDPLDLDVALAQGRLNQDRASIMRQAAEWPRAEQSFRRAIALSPNRSYVRNRYGAVLASQGKHADAIAECRASLSLDPEYAATYGFLADSLAATGSLREAVESYRTAEDLDPSLVLVRINLAELYLRMGRSGDAVSEYEAAVGLAPDDQQLRSRLAELRRLPQ